MLYQCGLASDHALSQPTAGGSAAQSELIHQRIRGLAEQTQTPVITFAEDVAASGGVSCDTFVICDSLGP